MEKIKIKGYFKIGKAATSSGDTMNEFTEDDKYLDGRGCTSVLQMNFEDGSELSYIRLREFDDLPCYEYYVVAKDKATRDRLWSFIETKQFKDIAKGNMGLRGLFEYEIYRYEQEDR